VPKPSTPSLVDMFKKGIKRDPSVYPTLKDKFWNDNWHRSFANQARSQDLDEVLDENYLPTTSEQYELFQEKQKYLNAILDSKVETTKGKASSANMKAPAVPRRHMLDCRCIAEVHQSIIDFCENLRLHFIS
jgi:hypothetical protein